MTTAVEQQDTITDPPPPAAAEEVQTEQVTHLARCLECDALVKFQPSASGASFIVLDTEISYGISSNGLPMCPNGHGEMTVADEQLPADEAITQVAQRLDDEEPQQGTLPGIVPPFNYQGAYLELEEKALEVDRLHHDYVDAAAEAKDAKKAWDKAAETYTKMALELRRRRREKVDKGEAIASVDPDRCAFQQLHPDTPCPVCTATDLPFAAAPKDAAEHAQQAEGLLRDREVVAVEEALFENLTFIERETIRGWTDDERAAVKAYADAWSAQDEPMPPRPDVLGKNHVAGPEREGEPQVCTQCDAVIAEGGLDTYPQDALVGTTCPGKPVEAQRYPKRHGAKKTKKSSAKKK